MDLMDNNNFFTEQVPIADGVQIEIQIGDDSETQPYVMNFRIWKFDPMSVGGVTSYKIVGYYDSPLYMLQSATDSIRATSYSALQQIASKAGLDFDGDQTSDLQTWMPRNQRYGVFATEIARHGYLDGKSFMKLAVTMDGLMLYKNLSNLDTNKVSAYFIHEDPTPRGDSIPVYQVFDRKHIAASGMKNARGGYAQSVVKQSVLKEGSTTSDLNVKQLTENLMINSDLKEEIDRNRVDVRPIDCGNVHDKYEEALYQNYRNSLVYAVGVNVLLQQQADLDLFDLVNYTVYQVGNSDPELNEALTATYLISSKVVHIQVGNYFEVYGLYTTGMNKQVVNDGGI